MSARRARLIRPLLEVWRDETRAYCRESGLSWREDESNLDRTLARNRLRHEVVPQLRAIHPAAERNLLATAAELRDEQELLERAVEAAMAESGAGGVPPSVDGARLAGLAAPLRRLVLRRLAEQAASGPVALDAARMREIERLAAASGSAQVDVGGGVRAVAEYGVIRFVAHADEQPPRPVELPLPGSCRFGEWEVFSQIETRPHAAGLGSLDEPVVDAARLTAPVTVRAWANGDRIRPLGLDGSKSLQDVFTDRKVPRSLRRVLPVVESRGEIAWVAGVVVSEAFKVTESTETAIRLRARAAL
jgi:tRNA(Ile)-lysidine synthase